MSAQVSQQIPATMDLYERKFAEMQKYIPFLEAMIERLKRVKDNSRESQLQKMQSLHGILSNSNGKKYVRNVAFALIPCFARIIPTIYLPQESLREG